MDLLKTLTIAQVHRWRPCSMAPGEKYSRDGLRALFGGDSITPLAVLYLPIPAPDKLWVLLHPEIIPERDLHLLACAFVEHVLPLDCDPRSRAAIEIKRRWVDGQATDDELAAAARAARAAWDAERDAAWSAVVATMQSAFLAAERSAMWAAERTVVRSAVLAAARSAEHDWQLAQVRSILERL